MNNEFLRKVMWEAHYTLKSGTNASYILTPFARFEELDRKAKGEAIKQKIVDIFSGGGEMLLPIRICIIADDCAPVSQSGRGTKKKVAQMKAVFTKPEESPYKIAKPYKVCTSIWQCEGYKCYFWGTIGLTKAENTKPQDNGDLVVFYTENWKEVGVYIFKGLAKPNDLANLDEIVEFIDNNVTK